MRLPEGCGATVCHEKRVKAVKASCLVHFQDMTCYVYVVIIFLDHFGPENIEITIPDLILKRIDITAARTLKRQAVRINFGRIRSVKM